MNALRSLSVFVGAEGMLPGYRQFVRGVRVGLGEGEWEC